MSENTTSTSVITESPASWNTKYIDTNGFICQLTLRADNGKELLGKVDAALNYLLEQGCQPYYYSPGNGYKKPEDNLREDNGNGNDTHNSTDPSRCPIHDVEMKRWEKDGRVWYSHKQGDGWCSGKAKNGKR